MNSAPVKSDQTPTYFQLQHKLSQVIYRYIF